jgi:hypothetical protein
MCVCVYDYYSFTLEAARVARSVLPRGADSAGPAVAGERLAEVRGAQY